MEVSTENTNVNQPPVTARVPIRLPEMKLPPMPSKADLKSKFWPALKKNWRRFIVPVGIFVALVLGYMLYGFLTTESTDDSFVVDRVHQINSRVLGTVIEVLVNDNQIVKKDDVLLRLDPKDFEVALKIAEADAEKTRTIAARWHKNEVNPFELIQRATDIGAALDAAANLEKAQLNLQYATIRAPTDGKVGSRSVETGQLVLPGQPVMALVEQTPWVVANFKESQVSNIRVGQKVKISVDAIGGQAFTGRVDSWAPGSGAAFALLPPDNATGNFTKIVQRIPVKITFDADSIKGFKDRIVPGMSTLVTVDTN